MIRITTALTSLLVLQVAQANTCDALRNQIEEKIKANGVTDFQLRVVPTPAPEGARVVGSCAQGSQQIVYTRTGATAAAPTPTAVSSQAKPATPRPAAKPIITECKDGRVISSGDCGK